MLQNIPATGYNASQTETESTTMLVSMNMKGIIALSVFSAIQLMEGAKLPPTGKSKVSSMVPRIHIYTLAKVYFVMVNGEKAPQEYTREEVEILIEWLLRRMEHCEMERDTRAVVNIQEPYSEDNAKFNPDTYIGQKLLLLELKSWLMYSAVSLPAVREALAE